MTEYIARTLINKRTFLVYLPTIKKPGIRSWIAMQLVGMAVTIAGDLFSYPILEE